MAVRKPTALLIAAATFAAASVLGLTGAATAGTPTAASTGFAAQTQRAGLTAAQADRSKAPVKPACPYGHLCIWANGNAYDYHACGYFPLPSLAGNGTWVNNQTPGTVARFYNRAGRELWNTGPAYSSGTADWTLVGYVRPC
ncbi:MULTISPECIES: hypothetical protein [Streptomyces]|uniref:Peptidase inhibitor n=1 Tax=Streptomyces rimosus subsp. rimosus TaxID=132474 RepID=A0ABY3ZD11_STRRM|nr:MULTISPECIES: hypothetical protein [Streptomyces]KUJ39343.1 hypothetical protein ADK46_13435 [Streptomyces rimosus subsp. rimosus]UNZ08196.1 hypothetical protein SRIMR7_39185 [Streptomyces rimosus subsp. rimosus]